MAAAILALWSAAAVADPYDDRMSRLAEASGCTFCHSERPQRIGDDAVPPPAPAWSEIARRYRGQRDAEDKLVAIVMRGVRPEDRHWAGKTSAVGMPDKPVEIKEEDARTLIRWILR
jgi:cytochrome c